MKQNDIDQGRFSDRGRGLGTVTEAMVEKHAREIAVINGRNERNVLDSDVAEARRELQGKERLVPTPSKAESLPEESRSGTPESAGHAAETVPAPDEQTFAEKLVEEGVADAEHDQEFQATRDSLQRDRTE